MFTSIFETMQNNQALNLNLMRTGDKLVVCFQPLASNTSDATGSNLTPLVITGTPAELDARFISAIRTPLKQRFEMLVNLDEFKKSTQKAQQKASAKNQVSVEEGSASTNSTSKKSKKDEQIEEAEKLVKANNLPGAYAIYKKLYEQDKTDSKIANRMHELWALMSQKTMFPEEETIVPQIPDTTSVIPPVVDNVETVPVENEEPQEDMFAKLLNPEKVGESAQVVETVKPVAVPPGVDPEQYQKFLQYQEFMKSQQVAETI